MAAVELINSSLYLKSSLRAYYRFENASDSKNSYHLTPAGSPVYNGALFGNGANLGASNSANGYDRNDALGIGGTTDVSFSFWVKLQTEISSGEYDFIYFDTITDANRLCVLTYEYNGGTRRLRLYGSNSGNNAYYTVTLGTSDWHYIVGNIARGGGVVELFLDGNSVASTTSGTSSGNGVDKIHIGKADTGSNWASCIFDDMAVFSEVLTSTEIANHYMGSDSIVRPSGASFLLNFV